MVSYERLSYEGVNALMCYMNMYDKLEKTTNINVMYNQLVINSAEMGLCRFLEKTHSYSQQYFGQWYTARYTLSYYHLTPHVIARDQNFYTPTGLRCAMLLAVRKRIQLLNTYIEHLNYVGDHTDFVDESGYIALPDAQSASIRKHAQSEGVWKALDNS